MITTFANQKGGVGKTTLSTAIAGRSLNSGNRVALVDADPQQSIMAWSDNREYSFPDCLTIVSMAKKTLHRDIGALAKDYDHVIIDAPPRSTDIARSAILAADLVIIPCTPSPYDVWASLETIELIREARVYKPNIKCGFVINRKITGTALGRDVVTALEELASDIYIFDSVMCQRVIYAECSKGTLLQEIDKEGKGMHEINKFYEEIMRFYHEQEN